VHSSGPDIISAMSTGNWLDFVGISIDPRKAEGMRFTINLVTPDNGEKYIIEMSNATLTNIKGEQAQKPDLTITVNRTDLNQVLMGAASFDDLVKSGKATLAGDRKPFDLLLGIMVAFTPDFEIMPAATARPPRATSEDRSGNANPLKLPDMAPPNAAGD
jgi:alkyl sulfatase BDS1-like metallo-beta-lactamase superfamily hydrolase